MPSLRVASAQINTTIGDIEGNLRLIRQKIGEAVELGCDLVAFPELTITGYPPEDLVLYTKFVRENRNALRELAADVKGTVAVVGFVDAAGADLFNAAAVLADGEIATVYHKIILPNYGVFDERRYFKSGSECPVLVVNGARVGVNVCEDIWEPIGPSEVQCMAGAQVIVNINGSPYEIGKQGVRVDLVTAMARRNRAYVVYTNQVGGQDELVFDGGSMVAGPDGELIATAPRFEEHLLAIDLNLEVLEETRAHNPAAAETEEELAEVGRAVDVELPEFEVAARPQLPKPSVRRLKRVDAVYRALVLGTRDYVKKTGFEKVTVALSGGIDSSLVAAIAVDALGAENVVGVSLPSRYSSEGSVLDARELSERLGIDLWSIPIEPGHRAFEEMLEEVFADTEPGTAEENVQARIRGNVMMAIANKFSWLVLITGNKSEMATGYATLYGDMAGAFAALKDVPKTLVYELSRHRNERGPGSPIPQSVLSKAPSAELRPGQRDEDSLPPYEVLDRILHSYIEERLSMDEIIKAEAAREDESADADVVRRVVRLVDVNEYKRRQSPPGIKITGLAFGKDRRMPIASRWRG